MSAKKYLSRNWLYRQHIVLGRSPEEIAAECDVAVRTIYRKLVDFKITKKR